MFQVTDFLNAKALAIVVLFSSFAYCLILAAQKIQELQG